MESVRLDLFTLWDAFLLWSLLFPIFLESFWTGNTFINILWWLYNFTKNLLRSIFSRYSLLLLNCLGSLNSGTDVLVFVLTIFCSTCWIDRKRWLPEEDEVKKTSGANQVASSFFLRSIGKVPIILTGRLKLVMWIESVSWKSPVECSSAHSVNLFQLNMLHIWGSYL